MKTILLTLATILIFGGALASSAQTEQSLTLRAGQQKAVARGKLKIKFVSLVEDSRCPAGTNCIWAGSAKIQIQVKGNKGVAKTFDLNTGLDPRAVTFEGYEIRLADVSPKPTANAPTGGNDYAADLTIRRL